ncbi:hypothetical protein C8A00DRAFT_17001 [Chaetomidium leptoderma]|uniref:AB hydrolase-1 domain-containing protein n=1 Tax=Chaetomidium leptoderma TaxID=669021 RepID=A0AAN6VHJ5_9PEZI|nr:hypothetical protein C8A00DRAFT_17001 [Chaetomidium leptoderma]
MDIRWANIKAAEHVGNPTFVDNKGFHAMHLKFKVPLIHPNARETKNTDFLTLQADLVYERRDNSFPPPSSDSLKTTLQGIVSRRTLLVYLCGGPGAANPAFENDEFNTWFIDREQPILYLNYRGTDEQTCPKEGSSAKDLVYFRQDAIVADLEAIRLCLDKNLNKNPDKKLQYRLFGQSFGGWIALTALSFTPGGLKDVMITAGMAPVKSSPDEVYEALYKPVIKANEVYYGEYPQDKERVKTIVEWLAKQNDDKGVQLPDKQRLTARGFLTMGRWFGREKDGRKEVHKFVKMIAEDIDGSHGIKQESIKQFATADGAGFKLDKRPLYAVLHELIYCHGPGVVSNWAAQRVGRQQAGDHFAWLNDDFDFNNVRNAGLLYFSGEMIYEFMLDDAGPNMQPLIQAAKDLAQKNDWPALYDKEQLHKNKVPVKVMSFQGDMYVDTELAEITAGMIGSCARIKPQPGWSHRSIKKHTNEVLAEFERNE